MKIHRLIFAALLISGCMDLDQYTAECACCIDESGTANCYIISEPGAFSFDASVMGNGDEGLVAGANFTDGLGNVLTSAAINTDGTNPQAAVLWKHQSLAIINVIYVPETKRIEFIVGDQGNAVIALYDDVNGNRFIEEGERIIWSWHIWVTDEPQVELYKFRFGVAWKNRYTMMDRNLGAIRAVPGVTYEDSLGTYGLYYQWGRKDPFVSPIGVASLKAKIVYGKTTTYNTEGVGTTLGYAIQNPNQFIVGNGNSHWLANQNNALWGNASGSASPQKTIYDPCPPGWMVPSQDAWDACFLVESNNNTYGNFSRGWFFGYNGYAATADRTWYPAQGNLNATSGAYTSVGYEGSYWAGRPYNAKMAYALFFNASQVQPLTTAPYAQGLPVRCAKVY